MKSFDYDFLIDSIKQSKNVTEIAYKYFGYFNSRSITIIKGWINEYPEIEVSHIRGMDTKGVCLKCGINYKKPYKASKFCSHSCSATYSNTRRKHSKETKVKIRNTLEQKVKKEIKLTKCLYCKNELSRKQTLKKLKYCSRKCSNSCPLYRKMLSEKVKKRIAEGKHKGWNSRNIESYPEKFFKGVLDSNGVEYTKEYKVLHKNLGMKTKSYYFLDFYIEVNGFKIDLEIDGGQHKYRVESDTIRDEVLTKNGYIVHRIPWKAINTPSGKIYIREEIEKLLKLIDSLKNQKLNL